MWWAALGLSLALAQDCPELAEPAEALSVVWVSPLRARTGNNGWLEVHPSRQVAAWLATEDRSVGDLLRLLGRRKRAGEPRKTWKVTVFDIRSDDLCRPIDGIEVHKVAGVRACEGNVGHPTGRYSGCGHTTDQATGDRGPDVFRARWRDLARRGFCVVPADRFVAEGAVE